jgi:Ca-activated chloride channel family protein
MMQTMMVSAAAPVPPPGLAAPGAAPKFAASGMVTGAPQAEAAGGFGGHARMLPTPAPMSTPRQSGRQEPPREQLAEELERLRAVASLPVADRLRHLEDLGSRLSALAVYLGGHAELEALARDLQSGGDVDTLMRRAVEGLEALIGPGRRRAFWKR